jgi:aspartyl/asparaginyl-tRNA synthetase
MIRVPAASLREHVGEIVTVAGWVQTLRLQRAMQFVLVRDHTGTVQVTHRRDGTAIEAELERLTVESAVRVTGVVTDNPVVSLGGLELFPEQVIVENRAATPLPVDDNTAPEGRLDWRFLDVRRRPAARLVFAVQTDGDSADLDSRGERAVAAAVRERTGHEFVFVTEFPASVRPFYHMRAAGNPAVTLSFDLL